jgi:amino acid permease
MQRLPGSDPTTKTNLFRILMVALSCTIAIITPHFGLFVNLIGSVACASLAFIMPMMFHTRLHTDIAPRDKIVPAFVIVIGVLGGASNDNWAVR